MCWTNEARQTALAIARPGSIVGYVGVPHGTEIPVENIFYRNVGVRGGPAPVRAKRVSLDPPGPRANGGTIGGTADESGAGLPAGL